jgi:hypothetical protein
MQVEVKEIQGKKVFEPVSVVLNFENKEDFDMFFNIVEHDRRIPEIVSSGYSNLDRKHEVYEHCERLMQSIHSAMREHKCK